MTEVSTMVVLTEAELDAVAAGHGLVDVDVGDVTVQNILNENEVDVTAPIAAAVAVAGLAIAGSRARR